jgi:hypothetical protein
VTSRGTERFWKLYAGLPSDIKAVARKAFVLFRENQAHHGLHDASPPAARVRVNEISHGRGWVRKSAQTNGAISAW